MEQLILFLTVINGFVTISNVFMRYAWKVGLPLRTHAQIVNNLSLIKFVITSLLEIDVGKNSSMNCKTLLSIFEREWIQLKK